MTARDAYSGMGAWIGSHMPLMSLVCLALGVALPELISPLKALVSVMFAVITFQGALGNTLSQLAEAFRRPVAMLSILLVSAVLMPCAGCVVGNLLFGSDPEIVCGIVLEYSVPVAVLSVMWTGIYEGNGALAVATVLVSTCPWPA